MIAARAGLNVLKMKTTRNPYFINSIDISALYFFGRLINVIHRTLCRPPAERMTTLKEKPDN